jgi:hypothetical protein
MRKLFFMLAFVLVGTFAFANTELNTIDYKDEIKTELLENGDIVTYNISVDEFDICTVTVTIEYSDGVIVRGRATSNSGNCAAAESAALSEARDRAAEIGR